MTSSLKNKRNINEYTIIDWYKKQNKIGKNINQKLGWPKYKGFKVRYKIMEEIIKKNNKKISVLDIGCGFSKLYEYQFKKNRNKILYTGLDAINSHIKYCQKKYPQNTYLNCTIDKLISKNKFDYIFANGVFTVKRNLSHKQMFSYTKKNLKKLFKLCKIGFAVNFISKNVDWERNDLFHLSMDKLTAFVSKNLSKKFIIRNDYNLYEYTIYIYR